VGFNHWHLRALKSDGHPPLLVMFKGDIWQAVILAQHFLIFDPIFFRYPVSRRNTDWKDISSHHVAVNAKKTIRRKKTKEIQTPSRELTHPTPPLEVPKIIILKSVLGRDGWCQFPGGLKET